MVLAKVMRVIGLARVESGEQCRAGQGHRWAAQMERSANKIMLLSCNRFHRGLSVFPALTFD